MERVQSMKVNKGQKFKEITLKIRSRNKASQKLGLIL